MKLVVQRIGCPAGGGLPARLHAPFHGRLLLHQSHLPLLLPSHVAGTIASCSWDHSVRLWDVGAAANSHTFNHNKAVYCVAAAPGGEGLVAFGGAEKTLRVSQRRRACWPHAAGCGAEQCRAGTAVALLRSSPGCLPQRQSSTGGEGPCMHPPPPPCCPCAHPLSCLAAAWLLLRIILRCGTHGSAAARAWRCGRAAPIPIGCVPSRGTPHQVGLAASRAWVPGEGAGCMDEAAHGRRLPGAGRDGSTAHARCTGARCLPACAGCLQLHPMAMLACAACCPACSQPHSDSLARRHGQAVGPAGGRPSAYAGGGRGQAAVRGVGGPGHRGHRRRGLQVAHRGGGGRAVGGPPTAWRRTRGCGAVAFWVLPGRFLPAACSQSGSPKRTNVPAIDAGFPPCNCHQHNASNQMVQGWVPGRLNDASPTRPAWRACLAEHLLQPWPDNLHCAILLLLRLAATVS